MSTKPKSRKTIDNNYYDYDYNAAAILLKFYLNIEIKLSELAA